MDMSNLPLNMIFYNILKKKLYHNIQIRTVNPVIMHKFYNYKRGKILRKDE